MSLFAFILVLGIVVDDAIIIAESAYTYTERRGYNLDAIVAGARRVAIPATFGVLTTMVAFAPMLLVRARMEPLFESLSWVVVFCLLFSLVESKLVLPSHLAIMKSSHGPKAGIADWVDRNLKRFANNVYKPFLRQAIAYRYATLAFFCGLLILVFGLVTSGVLRYVFFPEIDNDFVRAEVELQEGVPDALILDIVHRMDAALREINEEVKAETGTDLDVAENMYAWVSNGTSAFMAVELAKGSDRPVTLKDVENRWREKVGEIAGTKELRFFSSMRMGGRANIELALLGNNYPNVEEAAEELAEHLRSYDGVYEVTSSAAQGPEEIKLRVKPEAEAMGVTLASLARQVREAFYGAEVQRIQRDNHEIRVMVRYPRSERRSVGNLGEHVVSPAGRPRISLRCDSRVRGGARVQRAGAARWAQFGHRSSQYGHCRCGTLPHRGRDQAGLHTGAARPVSRRHAGTHRQLAVRAHGTAATRLRLPGGAVRDLRADGDPAPFLHPAADHHERDSVRHRGRGGRPHDPGTLAQLGVHHRVHRTVRSRRQRQPHHGGLRQQGCGGRSVTRRSGDSVGLPAAASHTAHFHSRHSSDWRPSLPKLPCRHRW